MKLNDYFSLHEFVSKDIYYHWKDHSKAVRFVNKKMLDIITYIRKEYGKKVIINNWYWGGDLNYRGFREPWCKVGAELSDHRFTNALDFSIEGEDPKEVFKFLIRKKKELWKLGMRKIEDISYTPTWNHISCASIPEDYEGKKGIVIVTPRTIKGKIFL